METNDIKYWALHSNILLFFTNGGTFIEAINKWKNDSEAVCYFYKYYITNL